jgi:altronate dehydratase large subunit
MGYRRPDGRVGIRNHLVILSTVTCANVVAEQIGRRLGDDAIAITHSAGCGQGGDDLVQTRRTFYGTATHPNVGAVLLVGLGCETIDTRPLADEVAATGKPAGCLLIQDEGGTRPAVARGVELAQALWGQARIAAREPIDPSELIVGTECGGSDGFSGISANPAVGAAADRLTESGGTVILSEVTEFIGAEHILARRARDAATASALVGLIERREREAAAAGVDLMGAQINPGNFEGGLTTPEEKSLGTILKGGSGPLQEVIAYAQRPSSRGLVVMDTPGEDVESMTGMVAGGAQIIVFTTGRGTPTGNAIAPVIKVASHSALYRRWAEDIDVDAGSILDGRESIGAAGQRIFDWLCAVVNGQLTCSEELGHREFAINFIGPKL